jgi:uncharacterized protein (TIGR02466 family)
MTDSEPQAALAHILELFPVPIAIWWWPEAHANKAALMEAVEKRRRASKGIVRTNVNGWHSETDLPNWPDAAARALVLWIVQRARQTSQQLNGESNGDVRHWRMNGWANVHPASGRNRLHHHAQVNWHWSACYYLHLGPLEQNKALGGALVFHERGTGLALEAMKSPARRFWRHHPREGELVLFPSWLNHSVEPHFSAEPRISMAFNLHGVGLERCRLWQYRAPPLWRVLPRLMSKLSQLTGSRDLSSRAMPQGYDVCI